MFAYIPGCISDFLKTFFIPPFSVFYFIILVHFFIIYPVADQEQKIDDKPQEKKTQTNSNNYLKKTGLTQKQLLAILNTGIAVKVAETIPDKEYTVAFTKENKEKINQVLEAVNTQIQGKHMMR